GVEILGTTGNRIGGLDPGDRNLISGNAGSGVGADGVALMSLFLTSQATDNVVLGNFIGTDITGTHSLANSGDGVDINGLNAPTPPGGNVNNRIGGTAPGARNIISGNTQYGVALEYSPGNHIEGNFIGTDVNGTYAVPNASGVIVNGGPNNVIGGTTTDA